MPTYGLTTDGLIIKTLTVIRDELSQRVRDTFGASMRTDDRAKLGQLLGILSEVAALIWELIEQVNSSQDPDKATGAALDALCTLTGTFRPPASYSTVVLTLTGTPATIVPTGSSVNTESTGVEFLTTEEGTIVAASAWTALTVYTLGARVTNGGNVYQCTVPGTSDAAGGPATEEVEIVDATVTWTYLGAGTGTVDVDAQAAEAGPVTASSRDLIVINDSVAGWTSVINLLDVTAGRDVATDEELRLLREAELAAAGNTPIDALRGDLLRVPSVKAATVFANNSDEINADGMPPHSVEALIRYDGVTPTAEFDQSIRDALLANVAAGIQTHGLVVGTATDTQGTTHTMKFNRPTDIPIYIRMGITVNDDDYPEDGDDLVVSSITEWGDDQLTGKNAVPSSIIWRAFQVNGVLRADYVAISTAPIAAPTTWAALTAYVSGNTVINSGRVYRCTTGGTSAASGGPSATGTGITDGTAVWSHLGDEIAISLRELATYNSANIFITSTAGVP